MKPTPPPPPPPPKPYDARIEYLESSGQQWIDTGIIPDEDFTFDVEVSCETAFTHQIAYPVCGSRNSATDSPCLVGASGGFGIFVDFGDYSQTRLDYHDARVGTKYRIYNSKSYRSINELSASTQASRPFENRYSFYLFNINGNIAGWNTGTVRISSVKFNNGLTFDAIPVRVGNVGYMYDKVSGRLFGNAGTGDFILGPDIE